MFVPHLRFIESALPIYCTTLLVSIFFLYLADNNSPASAERINGHPENDNLTGTPNNDRISGSAGNDTLLVLQEAMKSMEAVGQISLVGQKMTIIL